MVEQSEEEPVRVSLFLDQRIESLVGLTLSLHDDLRARDGGESHGFLFGKEPANHE